MTDAIVRYYVLLKNKRMLHIYYYGCDSRLVCRQTNYENRGTGHQRCIGTYNYNYRLYLFRLYLFFFLIRINETSIINAYKM